MRDAQRCDELFRRLGYEAKLQLVVNRFQKGSDDHRGGHRRDGRRCRSRATVANDYAALLRAVNRGVLLREEAPRSPVTRDVEALAALVCGAEAPDAGRPRSAALLARSRAGRGQAMGLGERLRQRANGAGGAPATPARAPSAPEAFHDLKGELHRRIIDSLDLKAIEKLPPERLRERAAQRRSASMRRGSSVPLNQAERERMVQELLDELTGLGPLEPLLADPTISDILVNTYSTVYIERGGKLELDAGPVRSTTTTSCRSSTGSCRGSAAAWTRPRRWWTRASPTARA